jgi:hypothetical protein
MEEENVIRRLLTARLMRRAFVGAIAVTILIQLARPARTNPPTDPSRTMMAVAHLTPDVEAILVRGCRDCHSNDTRWPWYSNVAPISWFVIDHVNHGRRHFNYSDWAHYDADQRPKIVKDICELTRKGEMPVTSYLWLHSDARLSDRDVVTLCDWTLGNQAGIRDPGSANRSGFGIGPESGTADFERHH